MGLGQKTVERTVTNKKDVGKVGQDSGTNYDGTNSSERCKLQWQQVAIRRKGSAKESFKKCLFSLSL